MLFLWSRFLVLLSFDGVALHLEMFFNLSYWMEMLYNLEADHKK